MSDDCSEKLISWADYNYRIETARCNADYLYMLLQGRDDTQLCRIVSKIGEMLRKTRLKPNFENERDPAFRRLYVLAFQSANPDNDGDPFWRCVRRVILLYAILSMPEVREYFCPMRHDNMSLTTTSSTTMRRPQTDWSALVLFMKHELEQGFRQLFDSVGGWTLAGFVASMAAEYQKRLPLLKDVSKQINPQ